MKKFLLTIMMSLLFFAPLSVVVFPSTITVQHSTVHAQEENIEGVHCSPFGKGANFLQRCTAKGLEIIFGVTQTFTALTGKLFDYFIDFTLDSSSYKNEFISEGWKIVRNVVNLFFVFGLLTIAIGLMFNAGWINPKKAIIQLIVVALVINFSLFLTRVVIDAGNLMGLVFYNNIETTRDSEDKKQPSLALAGKVNPQKILLQSEGITESTDPALRERLLFGVVEKYIIILITSIAFNGMLIYIFVSMVFLFLSRTIALWFAMIFGPFAFTTRFLPDKMSNVPFLGFSSWAKNLSSNAFLAPVFLFFLYIIVLFLDKTQIFATPAGSSSSSLLNLILEVGIPMIFLIVLLGVAQKIAKSMSGEFGNMVTKYVGGAAKVAVGAAGGVALGGLAATSRAGFGRIGRAAEGRVANFANSDNKYARFLGRQSLRATEKMQTGSFDVRNVGIAQKAISKTGVSVGAGAGAGGYRAQQEKKQEEHTRRNEIIAKKMEVRDTETVDVGGVQRTRVEVKRDLIEGQDQLVEHIRDNNLSNEMITHEAEIERAKEKIQKQREIYGNSSQEVDVARDDLRVAEAAYDDFKDNSGITVLKDNIKSLKQRVRQFEQKAKILNQERRVQYAQDLEQVSVAYDSAMSALIGGIAGGVVGGVGGAVVGAAAGASSTFTRQVTDGFSNNRRRQNTADSVREAA